MSYCFCVVADQLSCTHVKEQLVKTFGAAHRILVSPSADELKDVKSSGVPIIGFVLGDAFDFIKSACDDVSSPERRVRLIYSLSAGVDSYRLADLKTELKGVPFCNAQGCFSNILAEHVIYSILHFNRFPWRLVSQKESKTWDRFNMIRMEGQKLGIIGYGNIGEQCGRLAVNMGMQVTAIKRSVTTSAVDRFGVTVRGEDFTDQLIRESDFLLGVLPSTPVTKGYFNKSVFTRMKPSAVFINIGRGVTQNETDLCEALNNNTIRGAALDVFEKEPLPKDSPVWTMPNDKVLLSPHCADWTEDINYLSADRGIEIAKELIESNKISAYTVDVEKGY